MTNASEFNSKYAFFLEEGHYGLDINIPEVVEYLDKVFEELTKIPGFKYKQIKTKFNSYRFYTNLYYILPIFSRAIEGKVEEDLQKVYKLTND